MAEMLQDRIVRLRGLTEEHDRLVARLAEIERKLAAEGPALLQLKELLERQRHDAVEKSRAADRKTREHPDSPMAVLERVRVEKVRASLEATYQDLEALLGRLSKSPAPSHAGPEQKPRVAAPPAPPAPVIAEVVAEAPAPQAVAAPVAHVAEGAAEDRPHEAAAPEHEAETDLAAEEEEALHAVIESARRTMESLDRCRALAHEVARGGAWHAIAGAAFAKSPDRAKIDNVREAAREAREDLGRFHKEIADLEARFGGSFHAGEISALAELVGGAILSPEGGEAGAGTAVARLCRAYHDVRKACTRMQLHANRVRVERKTAERSGSGALGR